MWFSTDASEQIKRTNRRTDGQTDALITIFSTPPTVEIITRLGLET